MWAQSYITDNIAVECRLTITPVTIKILHRSGLESAHGSFISQLPKRFVLCKTYFVNRRNQWFIQHNDFHAIYNMVHLI
jgi:BarA-like signal transduction histidine kinase